MFQTEIIIFIQSFASEFWTFIFRLFSDMGRMEVVIPLVIGITTGIHFRKGLLLMHICLWTGVVTHYLKESFALPRPSNVDGAVLLPGSGAPNPTPLRGQGAGGFFQGLPAETIAYLRQNRLDSFGFPSGHTSSAVALWGTLFVLFKVRWLRVLAAVMLVGIPLSRLYLGRHFLADVLGGYVVGALCLSLFYLGVYLPQKPHALLFIKSWVVSLNGPMLLLMCYFLLSPLLLFLLPADSMEPENGRLLAAMLLGVNLAFLFLWKRGLPAESGTVKQRLLRVLMGILLFIGIRFLLLGLSRLFWADESVAIWFVRNTLTVFISFAGGTEWAIGLGLFEREKVKDAL